MNPGSFLERRKKRIRLDVLTLYYLSMDPRVKCMPRFIVIIALAYAMSPIDLIPDFIPILGYLDDVIIISFLVIIAFKLIPRDVVHESRERAGKEPVKPGLNMVVPVIIIIIWLVLIMWLVRLFAGIFRNIID